MQVKAKARFIKISPKKVRFVVDVVRGMKAEHAENQLRFMNKAAAKPVLKLLQSAMANAEHNYKLKKENLYISEITANDGPTLHRWMPKAFGRATPLRKRSSHIHIILSEKDAENTAKESKAKKSNQSEATVAVKEESKKKAVKSTPLKSVKK